MGKELEFKLAAANDAVLDCLLGDPETAARMEGPIVCIEWLLDFGAPRQLLQLYGEAPLRPVCGARFLRRSVMLRLADGSRAELACDCGVLHGKTEELPFAEVELESKEGAPDAAKALADRLAKQYNLRWEPLSKFARANALK